MLQQRRAEDFVLATGETHSVREFVEKAFKVVGTDITYVSLCFCSPYLSPKVLKRWRGCGIDEKGHDSTTGRVLVKVDDRYFRPAEVECVSPSLSCSFPHCELNHYR